MTDQSLTETTLPDKLSELDRGLLIDAAAMLAPFVEKHDPILGAKLAAPQQLADAELVGAVMAGYDIAHRIVLSSFDLIRERIKATMEGLTETFQAAGIDINEDMTDAKGFDHDDH